MNLYELAFTSHAYNQFTTFNKTYKELLKKTGGSVDLNKAAHRKALIVWLNKWGCRQFALNYHQEASRELLQWHQAGYLNKLPINKNLWDLNEKELDQVGVIYDTLVNRVASKPFKNGRENDRTFGPTGASKILFALKPDVVVPWDSYIRASLAYNGSGISFIEYLKKLVSEIDDLQESCFKNGYSLEEVPKIIKRDSSTVAQLVGEYYWVTLTRKCYPPDNQAIQDWAEWSKRE